MIIKVHILSNKGIEDELILIVRCVHLLCNVTDVLEACFNKKICLALLAQSCLTFLSIQYAWIWFNRTFAHWFS